MSNIRKWLERAVQEYGEPLEAVVIGQHDNEPPRGPADPRPADENVPLPPEAALRKLDQDFDSGYGLPGCNPILAWSASRVFFILEEGGATRLASVPRNPCAIEPEFISQSNIVA